jgi:hypothetical protein
MRARRNHCDPALDRPAHGVEPRGAAKGPAEARHGVQQRQRDRVRGAGWCRLVDQPCTAPPSTMKPAPSQGAPTPPIARSSSWPARLHAPMWSGRVKNSWLPGLLVVAGHAGRSQGQGGAPDWTSDLDAGEDRRRIRWREGPGRSTELVSHAPIRASRAGRIRMTLASGPGCSVRTSAVLQAQHVTRAHPAV